MEPVLGRVDNRWSGQWEIGGLSVQLRVILLGAVLLAAFVGLFAIIQFATPGLAGNDGYYHMKIGKLMRQSGLTPTFYWLPLSILSPKGYYDHHFSITFTWPCLCRATRRRLLRKL